MTEHHPNFVYSTIIGLVSLLFTSFDWGMLDHVESILKIVVYLLTALSIMFTLKAKLNPKQKDETNINVDLE